MAQAEWAISIDPTPDWNPRWSPDGREIAFYAYRTGNRDIFVMPSSTSTTITAADVFVLFDQLEWQAASGTRGVNWDTKS